MGRVEHLDFLHSLDKCSLAVEEDVELLFSSLDPEDKNATRDALLRAYPRLVERDSLMAGKLAKDYYEAERRVVEGGPYRALIAPPPDGDDMAEAVRYACGHLYEGGKLRKSASAACGQLVASADRFMRQRAFGTLLDSAAADPLKPKCRRYAEPGACGFCKARATGSFEAARDVSSHLHEFCKCSVDVDFDGSKQREEDEFAARALESPGAMSEYEEWYVSREINGLWRKFKDEPNGTIWVGSFEYSFSIGGFGNYTFRRKVSIS